MKIDKKRFKQIYEYKGHKKQINKIALIIIFAFLLEAILIPFFTKQILDVEIPRKNINGIIFFAVLFMIQNIVSCYYVLRYCILRLDLGYILRAELKNDVFDKLQEVDISFYDHNTTGTILQFLTEDTIKAGSFFPRVIIEMVVMGLFRTFAFSVLLLFTNFEIGIGVVLLYLLGIIIRLVLSRNDIKLINEIRIITIEMLNQINEGIKGFTTIKTLKIEKQKLQKLESTIHEYNKSSNTLNKNTAKYNAIFSLVTSFTYVWLIAKGTMSLQTGIITYGAIMIIIQWTQVIEDDLQWFLKHIASFSKSYLAFCKIQDFLASKKTEKLGGGKELKTIEKIEFNDVSFEYIKKEKVLKNVNLKIENKKHVAFIGKTGSGKSTIVNLICKFYKPTKGSILINGQDIEEYNLKDLRSKIGYVMQDVMIVKNTIIDNIRYANAEIILEEIESIFKKINLHDKIVGLKDGYETNIFDHPDILSKGEKQLINFARIMAINPDVIILDEVTSSLSYTSERLIKNAIEEITKDKIAIIIAHRLSTIRQCDEIIVLNQGNIIEQGSHEELMKRKRRIL